MTVSVNVYCVSIRQHTSAYVSIRQHTSAHVSIRQHTSAHVSIRQHTSAHVSIRTRLLFPARLRESFGLLLRNRSCVTRAEHRLLLLLSALLALLALLLMLQIQLGSREPVRLRAGAQLCECLCRCLSRQAFTERHCWLVYTCAQPQGSPPPLSPFGLGFRV